MSQETPQINGQAIRWDGIRPEDVESQGGGPTAAERDAVRKSLSPPDRTPISTLDEYLHPDAVAARVKRIQEQARQQRQRQQEEL